MARATVPGSGVALLTVTSKMPCDSWSLPAGRACPTAFVGDKADGYSWAAPDTTTICGHCYAKKGSYAWAAVENAQETRFRWTLDCQKAGDHGRESFVSIMVPAIRKSVARQRTESKYFRVHDSGDLFSVWYVRAWMEICQQLADVRFWIPTRAWRSKNPALKAALLELAALPNVALRPSALFFNAPAPRVPGFAAGTTASNAEFSCPAPGHNNACVDCRACWDPSIEVSYRKH